MRHYRRPTRRTDALRPTGRTRRLERKLSVPSFLRFFFSPITDQNVPTRHAFALFTEFRPCVVCSAISGRRLLSAVFAGCPHSDWSPLGRPDVEPSAGLPSFTVFFFPPAFRTFFFIVDCFSFLLISIGTDYLVG